MTYTVTLREFGKSVSWPIEVVLLDAETIVGSYYSSAERAEARAADERTWMARDGYICRVAVRRAGAAWFAVYDHSGHAGLDCTGAVADPDEVRELAYIL